MSTDRPTQIKDIINKRKPYADTLKGIETKLEIFNSAIRELENRRQMLITQVNDTEAVERLRPIDFSGFIQRLEEESKKLSNLIKRFSRSTLNIGVVGRMRQGKSTLLQKLSGLSDDVIPARRGKACTAARSIICHKLGALAEAKVTLHSEDSFWREIILPYYDRLDLKPKPTTFNGSLKDWELPKLNPNSGKNEENIYLRLRDDYYYNVDKYQPLLGTDLPTVSKEKIKKYVAQEYDDKDTLTNPECLAVREVKISCNFPNSEVGDIALVDIPGLGDFRLGDEKLMIETLGQDVDIILFIRKPSKDEYQWQQEDTKLYDLADKALNDLQERSFIVLNADSSGDNLENCKSLKKELESKVKIPVVDHIIADCSLLEAANNVVLERVLKHLETEITNLDKRYARSCLARINQLQREVKAEVDKARNALEQFANEFKQFDDLFGGENERSGLWGKLTSHLGKLLEELREKYDTEDTKFEQRVLDTIKRCQTDTGIPAIEEIESQQYSVGGYPEIFYAYLKEIRANISRYFLSLDGDLQDSLEVVKSEVTEVLVQEGRLGELSKLQGSDFLKEIAAQLPKNSSLWLGFSTIGEFNLSVAGIIPRRVRSHFNELFSNTNTTEQFSSAKEIHDNLKSIHNQVIEDCQKDLEELYFEPNRVAYSMLEEFLDRVFYAKGAKQEWRNFLWDNRQQVWPEFRQLAARTKVKEEWENLVDQVEQAANQLGLLLSLT